MADVNLSRIGELLRSVLELLWNKPEGLPSREIISILPELTPLTEFEKEYSPSTASPRYEKLVRFATIPLVSAGWMIKNNKGRWFITDEGRQACRKFSNAQELYREALRIFEEGRGNSPAILITIEEAEEKGWEQIQKYLQATKRIEFQTLVADLLRAMGYHIAWIAPPEKMRGKVDIIAYVDPLGAKGTRILIQVKHKGQAVTLEGLNAFLSILGKNDYGLLVSTGGFTSEVKDKMREDSFQMIILLDLEGFFDLWVEYYSQLSQEARFRFPLKAVYFLYGLGQGF